MGQRIVNGLFLGSIYALFALGYTLVFGVLDILNLAHAAVFMLASFAAVVLGTTARGELRRDPTLDGSGLATAGLLLGWIGVALALLGLLLFLAFFLLVF